MMADAILSLKGVNKSFGPIDVLHDINLEIKAGEVLCLLGDNGAGKSTVIRLLSGVHKPSSGEILMDGNPVSFSSPRDAADHGIATVHQFGGTFPLMSIGRSFFVGREPTRWVGPFKVYDRKTANDIAVKAVQNFGITRIDDGDRLVGGLSGGERQRAAIAQALAQRAQCYLLDEPLQHLDLRHQAQTMQVFSQLKEQGCALMMVLHDTLWAQRCCDHVLLQFADGQVLHGTVQELLTRTHLEALYQCPLRELSVEGERWFVAGV
jgi:simple sugar transport system ATP-binding protein